MAFALSIYGGYATRGSWYYDDWSDYASMRDQHGGFFSDFHVCASSIPGNRTLACVYHAAEFTLFKSHRVDYQLVAIAFLVLDASLIYAIARQCSLSRPWALLLGAAFVLFPADDSARLWAVAAIGQYVVALVLGAVLLALLALRREGPVALLLHLVSLVLAVIAMATYEIAVPLVALGGALYYPAIRHRRALKRWSLDIVVVALFLVYRLVVIPVAPTVGFVVHRTTAQTLARARILLNGAWTTWKLVYLPGGLGTAALASIAVLTVTLLVVDRSRVSTSVEQLQFTKRVTPWLVLLAFGAALGAASALVYITANDIYVPQVSSTFNRLNLPGSFGYVAMAVAILGISYEILRSFRLPNALAAFILALIVLGSAEHQLGISADHIRSWEASWTDQQRALAGYRVALRGVPHTADVIGFDTPIWERGFVPVFTASWDLRGAIDYETEVNPPIAYPLMPGFDCGPIGVVEGTTIVAPYNQPKQPMYFVSPARRMAVRVSTQKTCARIIQKWGRPPFWGHTVM